MEVAFRRFEPEDGPAVAPLSVAAFKPIHAGFEAALGPEMFRQHHPNWRGG